VKSPLPFGCELPPEPPRDEIEPLDAPLARLHVTVSRRLLEKLDAAKDALAHACPGATAAEVFERGLDLVLAQHAKRKPLVSSQFGDAPRRERIPLKTGRRTCGEWPDENVHEHVHAARSSCSWTCHVVLFP
jgi:hypothetical protein